MTVEQAFLDWWDKPGRPTILNHRIAFEAGYRAASDAARNFPDIEMRLATTVLWGKRPPASVGRTAERQDAEERLGPKDEHAVPPVEAGDAQNPPKG